MKKSRKASGREPIRLRLEPGMLWTGVIPGRKGKRGKRVLLAVYSRGKLA